MNGIIKKCVEELSKEEPRLDYIRGMLDTLLEMNNPLMVATNTPISTEALVPGMVHKIEPQTDEVAILDARARAAIKTVQEMGTLE